MKKEILEEIINIEAKTKYFDINMKKFSLPVVEKFDFNYYSSLKKGLNIYNDYIKSLD